MEIIVYASPCAENMEHETAYRLLEYALRRELGIGPLPAIERQPGGKPYFPDYPNIHFNLSHSHGAAACALHDRPIGVDIERIRPAPSRLAQGRNDLTFFREWTAKEATIKRRGQGVGALLKHIEVDSLCSTFEELLPGWIITVCPSESGEVSLRSVDAAELV